MCDCAEAALVTREPPRIRRLWLLCSDFPWVSKLRSKADVALNHHSAPKPQLQTLFSHLSGYQLTLAAVSIYFILCCRPPNRYLCSDQVDPESQPQSSPGSGDNYIELPVRRFQPLLLSQCKRKIHRVWLQDWVENIFALRIREQVEVRQEGKLPEGS